MLDQEAGTAQLRARHPLNCEEKKNYVVTIAAVSRAGTEQSEEEHSEHIEEGELAGGVRNRQRLFSH